MRFNVFEMAAFSQHFIGFLPPTVSKISFFFEEKAIIMEIFMKIAYLSIWRKKLSPLSSTSCVWRVEKRNILSWQFLNERRKKRSHLWFSESELSLNKRNFPTTFFMYIVSLAHMWCHYSYSQTTLVQV